MQRRPTISPHRCASRHGLSRVALTICVTTSFIAAYRLYVAAITPITQAQAPAIIPPRADVSDASPTSQKAKDVARTYLPHSDWAARRGMTWQQGNEAFGFVQKSTPILDDERNKVTFEPLALVWLDKRRPEAPPVILEAEKARVTFEHRFEGANTDPGRIVAAELEGAAKLQGPDGLLIEGRNFIFKEEDSSLHSDEPVTFAFGPTRDSASQLRGRASGFEIRLTPGTDESLGQDLPRIVDFEHLKLYRDVRLNVTYDQDGELTPAIISSQGPFDFDRETRIASFQQNVSVVRTDPQDPALPPDTLECDLLELRFDELAPPDSDSPADAVAGDTDRKKSRTSDDPWKRKAKSLTSLKFHHLRAMSEKNARDGQAIGRVILHSPVNEMAANVNELQYDAVERLLTVSDNKVGVIERGLTKLFVRRFLIAFEPDQRVSLAYCEGPGRIEQRDEETREVILTAKWQRHLQFRPPAADEADALANDRIADLQGNVEVLIGSDSGLAADQLRLWIPAEAIAGLESQQQPKPDGPLPIRRILAEKSVQFVGPSASGKTERLDIAISEGVPPAPETRPRKAPGVRASARNEPEEIPWVVSAERVTASLIADRKSLKAAPTRVEAEGRIEITRAAAPGPSDDPTEGPIRITGHKAVVTNQGGAQQFITLLGAGQEGRSAEPAVFKCGLVYLEGRKIEVDRAKPFVRVEGQTLVRWPVDADLMGHSLGKVEMLDIASADGLTFDGQRAQFLRQVKVSLARSRLFCEDLIARVTEPVSFSARRPDQARPELLDIECRDRVKITMDEFDEQNVYVRKLAGELGRLKLNRVSGEFEALGPGDVREWRRGGLNVSIAPQAKALANRKAESSELPWTYTHLHFSGSATGNVHQQFGKITERVRVIYAPVDRANFEFTRQDLSQSTPSAERAVALDCDALSILLTKSEIEGRPFFATVEAEGKAELEGQKVHANAHQISFEQEKDLLTLRGRGNEKANVYYQGNDSSEWQMVPGQTITIVPSTFSYTVSGAGTLR